MAEHNPRLGNRIVIVCGGCGGVGGTHKPNCPVPMDDTWKKRR